MTLAYDAVTTTIGSSTLTWTHTPANTPRGIIVFIIENGAVSGEVSGVTYGGVQMHQVTASPNIHATGEPGTVQAFFLGADIPDLDQTVEVTVTGAHTKMAACVSITAADDTSVHKVGYSMVGDSLTDPTEPMAITVPCFGIVGVHSGANVVSGIGPGLSRNEVAENDFGSQTGGVYRQSVINTTTYNSGWTQTALSGCAISLAIREGIGPTISLTPPARSNVLIGPDRSFTVTPRTARSFTLTPGAS